MKAKSHLRYELVALQAVHSLDQAKALISNFPLPSFSTTFLPETTKELDILAHVKHNNDIKKRVAFYLKR